MRQRISRTLTLATLVVFPMISGCGPSEPDPASAVAQAGKQLDQGNPQGAIDILQAYEERKPGNPQIVEQLAFAWSQKGDLKTAAFYFNRLAELKPDRPDALLFAAQSLQQAGDAEGAMVTYQQYLARKPDDAGARLTFAALAAANARTDAAVGQYTYVYGIKPSGEIAVALGHLYLKKDDTRQAALWFEKARADNPKDCTLGLLEVAMHSQDYPQAEKLIAQVRKDFPGALEASVMKDAPDTIDRWQEKLAAEKKAAADAAAAKKPAEEKTAPAPIAEVKRADGTVVKPGESAAQPVVAAAPHHMSKEDAVAAEEAREDKADAIAAGAQPIAPEDIPATEDTTEVAAVAAKANETVVPPKALFTPTETAKPAEVATPAAAAKPEEAKPAEVAQPAAVEKPAETAKPAVAAAVAKPIGPALAEVLADARKAAKEGRQDDAARLYQTVLARNPSAFVWNEFSVLSINMGRPGQAIAASLEATRMDPYNLDYAIQYLSVVEKLYDERRVMSELIVMKRRFQDSPVISLALARAYWAVERNAGMSRYYYNEYLDKSPKNATYDEIQKERDKIPMP
jgi:Flp pilus assembly protein TadD